MGVIAGILSIDLQKFYDSVDLVLLMRACGVLGHPRIPLLLLVQAFLVQRTLRADGHHSNQVPVSNGLVAGSSRANHLAKALLHRTLHDHHHRCSKLVVSQFVDDLKMYVEGTTRQVVYRFSQPAVELFHSLGKLKVDLSPSKCGFVATTRGIALTACSGWQQKGFLRPDTRVTWVLMSASVTVLSPLQGKERNLLVSDLGAFEALLRNIPVRVAVCSKVEQFRRARMGTRFGAFSPTTMKRLRAAAAWTSGGCRAEMCTTTLLSITKTEPASRLHVEVITEYFVFLRDHPLLTKRTERAWQLLLRRFVEAPVNRRWFQVTGFLSNVVAILLELEWKPLSATHWFSDLEGTWTFDRTQTSDLVPIVTDVERASMRYWWKAASSHRHGESFAAATPDLTMLRRHLHSLRKRGFLERATMLQLAACRGMWTDQTRSIFAGPRSLPAL